MLAVDTAKMQGGSDVIKTVLPGACRLLAMHGQRGRQAKVIAPTSPAKCDSSSEQPKSNDCL